MSSPQRDLVLPELMALRNATPCEYPCISALGVFNGTAGCRKACCIVQRNPPTPDGADTPKWSAVVAERMEDKKSITQPDFGEPDFGEPETPPKTVLPEGYDPTTGWTPLGAEGWQVANARVNCDRPRVPGHSIDNPFFLATPKRDGGD